MANLGFQEILLIGVIIVLFVAKKIPEMMKGMGKGVREFKEELHNVKSDVEKAATPNPTTETDVS